MKIASYGDEIPSHISLSRQLQIEKKITGHDAGSFATAPMVTSCSLLVLA